MRRRTRELSRVMEIVIVVVVVVVVEVLKSPFGVRCKQASSLRRRPWPTYEALYLRTKISPHLKKKERNPLRLKK